MIDNTVKMLLSVLPSIICSARIRIFSEITSQLLHWQSQFTDGLNLSPVKQRIEIDGWMAVTDKETLLTFWHIELSLLTSAVIYNTWSLLVNFLPLPQRFCSCHCHHGNIIFGGMYLLSMADHSSPLTTLFLPFILSLLLIIILRLSDTLRFQIALSTTQAHYLSEPHGIISTTTALVYVAFPYKTKCVHFLTLLEADFELLCIYWHIRVHFSKSICFLWIDK